VDVNTFSNAISDEIFEKIVAVLRIAVPYTGIIVSTRESQKTREKVLSLGVSQISGGSKTSVGGYCETESEDENSAQFEVNDTRTLDEVMKWLLRLGYIPSFCTACYREGRTGDRFMSLVKTGNISNCCLPNALLTLSEYAIDYGDNEFSELAFKVIDEQMNNIENPKAKQKAEEYLGLIKQGQRDLRF